MSGWLCAYVRTRTIEVFKSRYSMSLGTFPSGYKGGGRGCSSIGGAIWPDIFGV